MSSRRARGLHLGRLSRRINDQKIIFRLLNNPFMLHERGEKGSASVWKKTKKAFTFLGYSNHTFFPKTIVLSRFVVGSPPSFSFLPAV